MSGVLGSGLGVQDLAAFAAAAGAVAWLTRRARLRRKRGVCSCDGCPVAERGVTAAAAPVAERGGDTLVTIDGLGPKAR